MTDLWGNRTEPDPLEEPKTKPERGPDGCRGGGRCDGSGWCTVTSGYARQLAKQVADARGITDDEIVTELTKRYSHYLFVYPCRACNGRLFMRWVGGHLDPAHDRLDCEDQDCQATAGHRRQR